MFSSSTSKEKRRKLGILFTFWWLIWKERNKRVFEQKEASVLQLCNLIQESIHWQRMAARNN
jgi:hypothetical protein